jgi:hypothetical protein
MNGGIGLISRLLLEGPLVKDKGSFLMEAEALMVIYFKTF